MRRLLTALAGVFLITAVASAGPGDKHYGKPLTIKEVTPLTKIIQAPEEFVGKEVRVPVIYLPRSERRRVSGYIQEMCENMGCWLGIMADPKSKKIVKVTWSGTEVRFPIGEETVGHLVEIQGKIITTKQEAEDHAAHMAEEGHDKMAMKMEHESQEEASGPTYVNIAIEGIGAIVKAKPKP